MGICPWLAWWMGVFYDGFCKMQGHCLEQCPGLMAEKWRGCQETEAPVDVLILVGGYRIDAEERCFSIVATAVHTDGHRGRCSIRSGPRAGVEVLLCLFQGTVRGEAEGP